MSIPNSCVSNHEEAGTCLILYFVHTNAENVVVITCDTDVLMLLVALYHKQ